MKHDLRITLLLLLLFLGAQFIGILILDKYIDPELTQELGKTTFKELPVGERPPLEESTAFIPIILAILLGTGVLLLIIKYKLNWVWKGWFLIAVILTLTIAFTAFTDALIAFAIALILGFWKIFKPNFWVHNFTELFIYGGLAAIFVPLFSLTSISILMVLIALYDMYAVWKSKHMVTLAKSQTEAKVFAGLLVPYNLKQSGKISKKTSKVKKVRTAILGGGDIGFPLLFAGVLLKEMGLWQALIIPFFAALGLGILLWKSQEKKFYPAMPFIGAGCFLGLAVVWVISL
jgi:presenilin-like A22 family membrane protease